MKKFIKFWHASNNWLMSRSLIISLLLGALSFICVALVINTGFAIFVILGIMSAIVGAAFFFADVHHSKKLAEYKKTLEEEILNHD